MTWYPETKSKTDCLMALWFCEIKARELCDAFYDKFHLDNQFLSERQKENQVVVDIDEWLTRNHAANMGA